ncbi:3',5'-cyclic-nucleotide phosphodiesterase [Chitinolyticbacter meiyuanensis]|uniref:3',5'-cyclic-nucleotide phosphodiesterase n=1 Tax=Chitinolyticbacter meiyuanensis TaxID=682798 RepID=UPI0011E5BF44|nr:3',5'-cyclic-nucleotide phosphodiesterase [Chitinolyticbacter meiyuanensis]
MKLEVLGCSGGIAADLRTTSLLLGEHALIDCGTGVGDLSLAALLDIDTVLLTHSHLDHTALLPMLADARLSHGRGPVTVHCLAETAAALVDHMFNGALWPDYTRLPTPSVPALRFAPLAIGDVVPHRGISITALPAAHSVPALGWLLRGKNGCIAFSGDTGPCPGFWQALVATPNLTDVIVETTFANAQASAAERAGHFTAATLAHCIAQLPADAALWITHQEPGHEARLTTELSASLGTPFQLLHRGQTFTL